jgi:hypothetical protein|uniref:Uncharacterized protein n=1 Tax=Zea mays TaxID=4577 RepID=B7ZZW5_MAIZE|nr:unknown [Zea mays]
MCDPARIHYCKLGLNSKSARFLIHTHIQPGVCLHGEFRPGDKNAIGIGVEPLAVANPGSSDVDGDVLLAHPLLVGLHRVRAESPDTDVAAVDLIHVPDAAVDQDTSPPVVLRLLDGVAAKDGAAHAAAAVDHEDPTVAFLLEELADQDVVLVDLERDDGAGEDLAPSVDLEDWLERAELAVHDQVRVSVAYFGGGQWQGSHIFLLLTPAAVMRRQGNQTLNTRRLIPRHSVRVVHSILGPEEHVIVVQSPAQYGLALTYASTTCLSFPFALGVVISLLSTL